VAATAPLAPHEADNQLERDLARVRQALEKPGDPTDDLLALAESTVSRSNQQPELTGEAHFLLGSLHLRLAEHAAADRAREERDKAHLHLESAQLHGVSPTDRARLQYLRGKLLFLSGGDLARCVDLLSKSLPDGADQAGDGYGLLVQAYLKKPVPDIDGALAANLKQMDYYDDDASLNQARLLRGELLLKKDLRVEAIKALDGIGPRAPQALRLKARALMARAATEEGLWARAVPLWRELLAHPAALPGERGRSLYHLGCCLKQLHEQPGHLEEAVDAWQKAVQEGGDEGQAAGLRLAEVHLASGNTQLAALDDLHKALKKVRAPADIKNKLVDLHAVRELLEETCRVFNKREEPEHFLDAAELYKRVAPPGAAEEIIARAAEARGRELLERSKDAIPNAGTLREQAYSHLENAAQKYEQSAEFQPAGDRADTLWRCIECYRLIPHEQQQTIIVLKKFVELPLDPASQAEAWYTLGELQRRLNQPEAVESFKRCVACNNEAFAGKARLPLAELAVQQKDYDNAEQIYKQVIKAGAVVDRTSYDEAMWQLGQLQYDQQRYDPAALQFRELLKNDHHPQALSARDLLGSCYRQLAAQALKDAESPEVALTGKKPIYVQRWRECLEEALLTYQQLLDQLERQKIKLLPPEQALQRKALFVVADCYFELPNGLDEAYPRYHQLWELCRKEGDGLWACQRLYACYFYASQMRHPLLEQTRFAAEDAVETCQRQFDDYVQAGVFRDEKEQVAWEKWLKQKGEEFRQLKPRAEVGPG
jgi:hypothetical protein